MPTATTTPQLPKSYTPAEAEGPVRAAWDDARAFHADPQDTNSAGRPAYCIVIPPPNVTAALHLGHAFNNSLQDVLIRYHRMRGFNVLWMPGTDHAGIATQTVVEKRLLQEGIRRIDLGRDEFVTRVQAWKDEYEATISGQLKELGCSCDWERQRFTMDDMCALAVRAAFFQYFDDGLIYRGKRLVNWDPVSNTALSDDEVEMTEINGHMWYLKYPVIDPGDGPTHVTVATTRPETMLGDTAVALNPRDPRAEALRGRSVMVPIVNRPVPIVEDDYVVLPVSMGGDPADPKSAIATGFLKVTPAHDPNDWDIGLRHDLPVINVMAPDASISAEHGWPVAEFDSGQASGATPMLGLSREDARRAIVKWFKENDLLEEVRDYTHSVGHSYRSHVPIEPYLSDQWYLKVSDDRLVGEAQRAQDPGQYNGTPPARPEGARDGDGGLQFFPAKYAHSYQSWHDNLRDWCISRQLWWGHRIPVWTMNEGDLEAALTQWTARADDEPRMSVQRQDGERGLVAVHVCLTEDDDALGGELETAGFTRDEDVLDTWFSSALWPFSTMGWPDPKRFPETAGLLDAFNPSSVLCTGRDIITLWVSRMVMSNRYFRDGRLPFEHVYINPMIQDGHGQRMSKSLGNGVDPRDIIHSHGADALRFTLVRIATSTQDVRLPVDMICPHCESTFTPTWATSSAGYRVAAPEQKCGKCSKRMVSGYGVAVGEARPTDDMPLARNASSKFDEGRNFANKLWNAVRFGLSNLTDCTADVPPRNAWSSSLQLPDRWILSRLQQTVAAVDAAVKDYQFNVYADLMYDFIWADFCDWYLEAIKPTVRTNPVQQQVLRTVLNTILRLLHPITPYVTETLWTHVQASGAATMDGIELPESDLVTTAAWPRVEADVFDGDAIETFERVQALVTSIRAARGTSRADARLAAPPAIARLIADAGDVVLVLAGLEGVDPMPSVAPERAVPLTFEGHELYLSGLDADLDIEAETARLTKLIQAKEKAIGGFKGKLGNERYVQNAPEQVVAETRARLADTEADLAAARRALDSLGGA